MPRNANQSKFSNYSINFDSDYIDLGSSSYLNSAQNVTVSAWINSDNYSSGSEQNILNDWNHPTANGHFRYDITSTGVLRISIKIDGSNYAANEAQSFTFTNGRWYNVVFVYDGTLTGNTNICKLYIDGQPQTVTNLYENMPSSLLSSSSSLNIGRFGSTSHRYFNGKINEVSIFDYSLSPSQVTTLWGGGTSVSNPMALPSAPIAYYPLGESAGGFRTPVNTGDQWLIENNAIGDYVFDFSSDVINTNSLGISGANSRTISCWFNADSNSTQNIIGFGATGSNGSYFTIAIYNSNIFAHTWNTGGVGGDLSGSAVNSGKWHLAVMTYDGTNLKISLDGGTYATTTASLNTTNSIFKIGSSYYTAWNNFSGKISNTKVWNTDLSQAEVTTLYNNGSPIRTLASIPQSSNLKAWYKLDASEIYNSSTTEWSVDNNQNPSAYPSSLNFDGVDDYIDCGDTDYLNGVTQMSVSVWFNADIALGGRQGLIGDMPSANYASDNGHFAITAKNNSGNIYSFRIYFIGTDSVQHSINIDNRPFTAGQWHNLVMTYNAGTVNFYVDGSLVPSTIHAGAPIPTSFVTLTNNRPLEIGRWASHVEWDGKISNPSIWNTELTSAQVSELYNNGTPSNLSSHSTTSNLVSWWKLNNTTTGIEDSKGSNNGTNNGATEYAGFVNKLVGESSGMSQANLVQSDLQTVAPYSKYAMEFDSADSDYISLPTITLTDNWSVSVWMNQTVLKLRAQAVGTTLTTPTNNFWNYGAQVPNGGADAGKLIYYNYSTSQYTPLSNNRLDDGNWHNWIITYNHSTTTLKCYIDGQENYSDTYNTGTGNTINRISNTFASNYWLGQLSNISIWNTDLTSAQVTEIYNQGLPSNLNSHSAYSNLVSWWQLGENSSFDGNNWIVADEKGTNNGESQNMTEANLTNGVGTTANGVSSGMSEGNLVGDAPYSTANAISSNMAVTARVTGSGNTP